MEQHPRGSNDSSSGDLVAQVNMAPDDESTDAGDWLAPAPRAYDTIESLERAPDTRAPVAQVLLLGLLALAVIAVSMFVILQGVFEMIPD